MSNNAISLLTKKRARLILYSICALCIPLSLAAQEGSVNAVLGDSSWLVRFADHPQSTDDERTRVAVHLRYVHDRLSRKTVQQSPSQSENRARLLDELLRYIEAGEFPQPRLDTSQRTPCFRDDAGRLCAVAHLIHASGNAGLVESINSTYRYDLLENMREPELETWQNQSGFSAKELAMIQPAYGFERPIAPEHPYVIYQDSITGLFGVMKRKNGRIVTPAQYRSIQLYMNAKGYGKARKGGTWAIVNKRGKPKTPFEYEEIEVSQNEEYPFFMVKKGGVSFFLNKKGRRVGKEVYDAIWQDRFGFIRVQKGQKWGILKADRSLALPIDYAQISILSPEHFIVVQKRKVGLVNAKNEAIIPMLYEQIQAVKIGWKASAEEQIDLYTSEGIKSNIDHLEGLFPYGNAFHDSFMLGKKNGQYGLINNEMKWMLPPTHDTLIRYLDYHRAQKEGKWGLYNNARQLILPMKYSHIVYTLSSFIVKENGRMGILDLQGKTILPVEQDSVYRLVRNLSGGLSYCYAVQNDGVWKIVNQTGEKINDRPVTAIRSLGRDLICIKEGEEELVGYYYQEKLHLYREHPFEMIEKISGWDGAAVFRRSGKYGLIRFYTHPANAPGFILAEAVHDSLFKAPLGYFFIFRKGERYGVMNSQGKVCLRAKFDGVYHQQVRPGVGYASHLLLFRDGERVLMDNNGHLLSPEHSAEILERAKM